MKKDLLLPAGGPKAGTSVAARGIVTSRAISPAKSSEAGDHSGKVGCLQGRRNVRMRRPAIMSDLSIDKALNTSIIVRRLLRME